MNQKSGILTDYIEAEARSADLRPVRCRTFDQRTGTRTGTRKMDCTIDNEASLSIADAIDAGLEDELATVGIRIVYTLDACGAARPWFQCPTPECAERCSVLHHSAGRLVCRTCFRSIENGERITGSVAPRRAETTGTHRATTREPRAKTNPSSVKTNPSSVGPQTPSVNRRSDGAMRVGKPGRELIENCLRVRVGRILARYGAPRFEESSRSHAWRLTDTLRIDAVSTSPHLGGIRCCLACPACAKLSFLTSMIQRFSPA